ncbi:MAG: phosphatidate cytidylyltransferase [candidate division Zixibacteria bacterium]|nr:phosphatidate cytidylyltransferase [candidate division Zixibacteria bacterium]
MENKQINQISFQSEFYRKLTHLGALVIPGSYYYFKFSRFEMLCIMVPIAIGMILIDISRLRGWRFWNLFKPLITSMARDHELKGDFTGAAYILTTVCLVVAIFDKTAAIASLAFIMTGDTAAALIGRKFGKHKYGRKSFEGSFGFLVAAIVTAYFIPDLPFGIGLIGAVVATITEGLSSKIDDNLTVPLISGLVMHLLLNMTYL